MEENKIVNIPFVAHESAMNRMERANKRLGIIAIVELVIIFAMFISVMIYFYLPTEVTEDTQSIDNTTNSQIHQIIGDN